MRSASNQQKRFVNISILIQMFVWERVSVSGRGGDDVQEVMFDGEGGWSLPAKDKSEGEVKRIRSDNYKDRDGDSLLFV